MTTSRTGRSARTSLTRGLSPGRLWTSRHELGAVPPRPHSLPDTAELPTALNGWSVLLAAGQLHAVLQPGAPGGSPVAWWQAHQALSVTEGWRAAVNKTQRVLVYAAPVGSIGQQPREDLLRDALDKAAASGKLVAASMPLAGTPGA